MWQLTPEDKDNILNFTEQSQFTNMISKLEMAIFVEQSKGENVSLLIAGMLYTISAQIRFSARN